MPASFILSLLVTILNITHKIQDDPDHTTESSFLYRVTFYYQHRKVLFIYKLHI